MRLSQLFSLFFNAFRHNRADKHIDWAKLEQILGFAIQNHHYYLLALTDPSYRDEGISRSKAVQTNNDRLEFLGDSIIGAVVSDILYKKYPESPVGVLSQKKAAIVSREAGDSIAHQLGIAALIRYSKSGVMAKDAPGNALEAIVGAIYLEKGFEVAYNFVATKIVDNYLRVKAEQPDLATNFKNRLAEWCSKRHLTVTYEHVEEISGPHSYFRTQVFVDQQCMGEGKSSTKKQSEQLAAKEAIRTLMELKA